MVCLWPELAGDVVDVDKERLDSTSGCEMIENRAEKKFKSEPK
jgi:hypothetical protein